MRNATRLGVVIAIGTSTVLGACRSKTDSVSSDTAAAAAAAAPAAGTATAPVAAAGSTMAADSTHSGATAAATMSDADILAMTHAANNGEIMTSKVALTKATRPDVRRFAQQMIAAHTTMNNQGNAVATAQNIKPTAAAADSINAAGKQMTAMLEAAPKGAAFDTAYVNGQAMAHTNTLAMVQKAEGQAQNAAVKSMLTKAAPIVQQHLDEAKALQGKLAGGAAQ